MIYTSVTAARVATAHVVDLASGTRGAVAPTAVGEPVGLVDVAPTICQIAGLLVPSRMDGAPLPTSMGSGRERVLTTWDSQFAAVGMHDRGYRTLRDDLLSDLDDHLPPARTPALRVAAPT